MSRQLLNSHPMTLPARATGQTFVEMVTAVGQARTLNLPPGVTIIMRFCPTCHDLTLHQRSAIIFIGEGVAETIICVPCLTRMYAAIAAGRCPDCGGRGRIDDIRCPTCKGSGIVEEKNES